MKNCLSIVGIVLSTLLMGCQRNQQIFTRKKIVAPKLKEDFTPTEKKNMERQSAQIIEFFEQHFNGFNGQFLVAKEGYVLFDTVVGFANIRKRIPLSEDTPMHVASVSKVSTALAVLRLVDKHKLTLDRDVRYYLSKFPYKGITLRMLLNHRSGVPYYGYFSFHTWHLGKTLFNRDILSLLAKHRFPLNFPPDKKFSYCNTNYALLALIIEKVTRKSFPKAMKELIFDPLDMKSSFILSGQKMYNEVCQSYDENRRREAYDYLDAVYGDKNMYTTTRDLLKLDLATYSEAFLSDSLRKQLFAGYSPSKRSLNDYGLGIRLKVKEDFDTLYFHSGWWHGNTACYTTLRKEKVCIIALSNVYSKNVYMVNRLSGLFGNYPYEPLDQ